MFSEDGELLSFATIPKTAKSQPLPYTVSVPGEKVSELRQLLKLSKIGPATYENLHANTKEGKFGITREWLINAKKEWETWEWRSCEDTLNAFPNYRMRIEDTDIHFLALFSERHDAVPVILLHGWPGSILEFLPLLSLMTQQYSPTELPYHLIVPSLPGYAFSSGPPLERNFAIADVARIMNNLMIEFGFGDTGYVAQGGDVGSGVLNFCLMPQPAGISKEALTFNERAGVERMKQFSDTSIAYALEHGSRPATIGLVLGSNPLSLLAWIGEKFLEWTDVPIPLSDILASVTLYWLTDTFPRAICPYREGYGPESIHHGTPSFNIPKPLGYSYFPKELAPVPISWVATTGNLCWSRVHKKGRHFAVLERPEALKEDLEGFISKVWKGETDL
ncbi:Alpha/Beta hydrolase protein [Ilyonectria sp. MPI-CAGE-AT-0026]|nr:Alpha/Beta hydrolase protein [Ilyonectria sp. MPI-CAGE-AT-0026]